MGVSVFSRDSLFFLSALCGFAAAAAPAFHQTVPGFAPSSSDNMNGAYPMSTTPGGTPGKFPRRFADYPGGAEHYDVYSPPMTTLYSQVWWSPLAPTPLPPGVAW